MQSSGIWRGTTVSWDAQRALDDLVTKQDTKLVYASVEEMALAMQAQLEALTNATEFPPWARNNLEFKQRLSGLILTAQGSSQDVSWATIWLDTRVKHCFTCTRLAVALGLPPSIGSFCSSCTLRLGTCPGSPLSGEVFS